MRTSGTCSSIETLQKKKNSRMQGLLRGQCHVYTYETLAELRQKHKVALNTNEG